MSFQSQVTQPVEKQNFMTGYLDALALVERLHRLLLDVIKDEFERVNVLEINAVQAPQEVGGNGLHASPAMRN